jgi:hypothetical protein
MLIRAEHDECHLGPQRRASARLMNSSGPAATAATNAAQVTGRTCRAKSVNGSLTAARPPAVVAAAVITWLVGARLSQRMWTSLLVIAPIGGLVVLGYSLQPNFVR